MDYNSQSSVGLATARSDSPWGSKDTVLIVEDNEAVAGLLRLLLGRSGLQIIWSQTGQDALAKFAQHRDFLAFVLSDCRLPDADGREICQQMRDQLPDLPLMLSSGTAACLNLGPLTSGKLVRFLPKPYTSKELLGLVEKLQLEAKQASAAISAGFV